MNRDVMEAASNILSARAAQNDELWHYGTPRHSGRFPYGSGKRPHQHDGGSKGPSGEKYGGKINKDKIKAISAGSLAALGTHAAVDVILRSQGIDPSTVSIGRMAVKGILAYVVGGMVADEVYDKSNAKKQKEVNDATGPINDNYEGLNFKFGKSSYQNDDGTLTEAGKKKYFKDYDNFQLTKAGYNEWVNQYAKEYNRVVDAINPHYEEINSKGLAKDYIKATNVETAKSNRKKLEDYVSKVIQDEYGEDYNKPVSELLARSDMTKGQYAVNRIMADYDQIYENNVMERTKAEIQNSIK